MFPKINVTPKDNPELEWTPSPEQKVFIMNKVTDQIRSYNLEVYDNGKKDFEEMDDCKYHVIADFK